MTRKLNKPIRMCVGCKKRLAQHQMLRLQCINKKLYRYENSGRSFYLCDKCVDEKKVARILARVCKSGALEILLGQLREIIVDVR